MLNIINDIILLKELNINNIEDLLTYFPYRYDIFEPINLTTDYNGERIAINVIIETTATVAYIRKNFNKLQFRCNHGNKTMYAVIFNRSPVNSVAPGFKIL